MSVFKKRGFAAHREESKRREKVAEAKRGRLFDYYLKDDDGPDQPIRFLTEEPITWYRHRIKDGNQFVNYACTADSNGNGCAHCDNGDRSGYVGSWLVVDGREFQTEERKNGQKTGKKVMVKDRLKLLTRGSTDIAKLDQKSQKYGLMSRPWFVTKTGTGQSTSYELDRGEPEKLTSKQLDKLIEQLPEKYRKMYVSGDPESLYVILESQIFGDEEEDEEEEEEVKTPSKPSKTAKKPSTRRPAAEEEEEEEEDLDNGVQSLDEEEEEEETPARKPGIRKPVAGAKKPPTPPAKAKPTIKKPAAKPLGKRK